MKLLSATYLTVAEHRELFVSAGFIEVEIFEERARGWTCGRNRLATWATSLMLAMASLPRRSEYF